MVAFCVRLLEYDIQIRMSLSSSVRMSSTLILHLGFVAFYLGDVFRTTGL